jgi:ribosomal protein L37E
MASSRTKRAPVAVPVDPAAPRARTLSPRLRPPDPAPPETQPAPFSPPPGALPATFSPPPEAQPTPLADLAPEFEPSSGELFPAPEGLTDEEILRAPPPWVVHPQACGGCGSKSLTERGLGACSRCGWQKPERERKALARRLATNPMLARRLAFEA